MAFNGTFTAAIYVDRELKAVSITSTGFEQTVTVSDNNKQRIKWLKSLNTGMTLLFKD